MRFFSKNLNHVIFVWEIFHILCYRFFYSNYYQIFPCKSQQTRFFVILASLHLHSSFEVKMFMQIRVGQPKYYKNHFLISQTFLQSRCHKGKLYYAYYRRITRMSVTLFRRQLRNLGPWVENRVAGSAGSIGFPEFLIIILYLSTLTVLNSLF
jgi:hypothetical protein